MKTTPFLHHPILVSFFAVGLPASLMAGIQEKESGTPPPATDWNLAGNLPVWAAVILVMACVGGFMLKKLRN